MGTKQRLAVLLTLSGAAFLLATPVQAQMTGTEALEACRRGMLPSPPNHNPPPHEIAATGRCFGIVDAALLLGRSLPPAQRHCAPADASSAAPAVVVAFLVRHRERLGEPFADLAVAAMKDKWPCG